MGGQHPPAHRAMPSPGGIQDRDGGAAAPKCRRAQGHGLAWLWARGSPMAMVPSLAWNGIITALLLASCLPASRAQQAPPLQGQGVDPVTLELVDDPVPVFMTVELAKLLTLDESGYFFEAIVNFDQSWQDPRAQYLFPLIEEGFITAAEQQNVSIQKCGAALVAATAAQHSQKGAPKAHLNASLFTSPDCLAAQVQPPPCAKYCGTYGQSTPNRFRCCDAVWLPDIELRNLIDTSQDRVVSDFIWSWGNASAGVSGVHRSTQVLGRFSTRLEFRTYPFDRQELQIFVDANPNVFAATSVYGNEDPQPIGSSPFYIVPSGAFWRLGLQFEQGPNRTGSIQGRPRDELAGWDISSVTFACANLTAPDGQSVLSARPISLQTQDFDPNDDFAQYYDTNPVNPTTSMNQTCAITISLARLSVTAVVQSVVPVAFIAGLSFLVFFTDPDALDTRLATEVTLFLSLTAVQFVFATYLPLASYLTSFDVFILLSYALIVTIILESFFVNFLCTRAEHHLRRGYQTLLARRAAPAPPAQELAEAAPGLSRNLSQGTLQEMGLAAAAETGEQQQGAPPSVANDEGQEKQQPSESEDAALRAEGASVSPDGGEGTSSKNDLPDAGTAQEPPHRRATLFPHPPLRRLPRLYVSQASLARNPSYAFNLACRVDLCCGVTLFVIYVTLSIVNFTVGLTA